MHHAVWVITNVTDLRQLGTAFREAQLIVKPFHEDNFTTRGSEDEDIYPPLYWDYFQTGGRWNGEVSMGDAFNHATGEQAAAVPEREMPTAVISPMGYPIRRNLEESPEELRRVLLNWPRNVVVAQDWHY